MIRYKIQKRRFLAGIAGAFFMLPAAAISQVFYQKKRHAPTPITSLLIGTITNLDSAKVVGARILETYGEKVEIAALTQSIGVRLNVGSIDFKTAILNYSQKDLRSHISTAVRKDFSAGRTTEVDGWILSDMECELCLLVAISEKNYL